MPEPDIEMRELSCELTQAELLQRGDAMADTELRIEQLKLQRGQVSDEIKDERVVRRKLAGVIDSGKELRQVRCAWIEDFAQNCFHLVRQDTGEVIDTRAMTAGDRQLAMGEMGPEQPEETIDLDDVPDDDGDEEPLEDDEAGGEDETPAEPEPEPEPVKTRGRGRGRQQQPTA